MTETSAEQPRGSRLGDAAVVAGAFLPLAYLVLAVVGVVSGREGVPLSPLLAALGTVPVLAALEWLEDLGNRREPTWAERHPRWLDAVGVLIYVLAAVPLFVGVIWPLPVLQDVGRLAAVGLHVVPLLGLFLFMGVSRYRHVRAHGCS